MSSRSPSAARANGPRRRRARTSLPTRRRRARRPGRRRRARLRATRPPLRGRNPRASIASVEIKTPSRQRQTSAAPDASTVATPSPSSDDDAETIVARCPRIQAVPGNVPGTPVPVPSSPLHRPRLHRPRLLRRGVRRRRGRRPGTRRRFESRPEPLATSSRPPPRPRDPRRRQTPTSARASTQTPRASPHSDARAARRPKRRGSPRVRARRARGPPVSTLDQPRARRPVPRTPRRRAPRRRRPRDVPASRALTPRAPPAPTARRTPRGDPPRSFARPPARRTRDERARSARVGGESRGRSGPDMNRAVGARRHQRLLLGVRRHLAGGRRAPR